MRALILVLLVSALAGSRAHAQVENDNWRNNFNGIGIDFLALASAFDGTNYYVAGQGGFRRWDGSRWHNELVEGATPQITALAATPLGVFAAGSLPGASREHFLFQRAGTNWVKLGAVLDDAIFAIAADPERLYIGGNFRWSGTNELSYLARLEGSDWVPVAGHRTNKFDSAVTSLHLDENGDLYAGGFFTRVGTAPIQSIARWDGLNWAALGEGLFFHNDFSTSNVPANAITRWNGDLYVAGRFTRAGTTSALRVARWDGAAWHALGAGLDRAGDSSIEGLDLEAGPSGLYVAGIFNQVGDQPIRGLALWNGTGWQAAADNEIQGHVFTIAPAANGLFLGGNFTIGGEQFHGVAQLADGRARALGNEMYGPVHVIEQDGGGLLLGGDFLRAGSKNAQRIVQYRDGEFSTLGEGMDGTVRAIAVAGDGSIFAGGDFTSAGSQPIRGIARWNGTNWSSLGSGISGANNRILALEWNDGVLYAAGSFNRAGTTNALNLAVWDGSNWSSIGDVTGMIYALEWHRGELYAGGTFTRIGNASHLNHLAVFNPATRQWRAAGDGVDQTEGTESPRVSVLRSHMNDLLVGGRFNQAGTNRINSIARWDGSRWSAFGEGLTNGVMGEVVAIHARGKELYVGGPLGRRIGEEQFGNVLHWDGAKWSHLGTRVMTGVRTLAALGNDLYVGSEYWPPSLNVWRMPTIDLAASTNRVPALGEVALDVTLENFFGPIESAGLYANSNLVARVRPGDVFTWAGIPAGEYRLIAIATNLNGTAIESAPVFLSVAQPAGNIPPNVQILSPLSNSVFRADQLITFEALATDADGTVAEVEFLNGYGRILPVSSVLPIGQYTVRARAIDDQGGTALSAPVSFRIIPANRSPIVFIENPFAGEMVLTSSVPVRVEASDPDGAITNLTLRVGPIEVALSSTNPIYTNVLQSLPLGEHLLTAIATDNEGRSSQFSVRFQVATAEQWETASEALPEANPFTGGWVTDGQVYTMLQTNGTLFIGGNFQNIAQQLPGSSVVELSSEAPDLSYPEVDGILNVIVPDGAGGYYIGGLFDSVGGHPMRNAAHVTWEKKVNTRWKPNPNWHVMTIAVDAEKVYLGGEFTEIGGEARRYLAAVRVSDGSLTDWNPVLDGWVSAIAIRERSLYVGGDFRTINGTPRSYLAAIDTATAAMLPWNGTANTWITELLVSGNRVYAAGPFSQLNNTPRSSLGAFDAATGELLPWDPWVQGQARDIVVSGSTLYIGGGFWRVGGVDRSNLAAVNAITGELLPWRPDPDMQVESLTVLSNVVYVSGQFGRLGQPSVERNRIAAVHAQTAEVLPLDLNSTGMLWSMTVVNDKVLAAGFLGQLRIERNGLAAFDAASGYARAWDPKCTGPVYALAFANDTLFVGGEFHQIAGVNQPFAAALNPQTGAGLPWNPSTSGGVHAIAIGVNGMNDAVYLGGTFQTVGGRDRRYAGSVHRVTGAVTGWNPILDDRVTMISADSDHVYLGGPFKKVNAESRNGFARVDAATGELDPFDPQPSSDGVAQVIHAGDTLFVRGGFNRIDGKPRSGIAALDKRSGRVTGWNVNVAPISMALLNNTLFLGGQFTSAGGLPRTNLAALDIRLRHDYMLPWAPPVGAVDHSGKWVSVIAASVQSVFVGGNFEDAAGERRPFVAGFPYAHTLQPFQFVPEGLFRIRLIGPLGRTYVFETSPDLEIWTPIMTNRAPFLFEDLEGVNHPRRFYRALPR